jgi:hypothetical protein
MFGRYFVQMIFTRQHDDIDIDAMGIPGPEGHPNATRGAEREKSKKLETGPKRRGPRWDLNPRGCEQEIGPDHHHQRTGQPYTPPCVPPVLATSSAQCPPPTRRQRSVLLWLLALLATTGPLATSQLLATTG